MVGRSFCSHFHTDFETDTYEAISAEWHGLPDISHLSLCLLYNDTVLNRQYVQPLHQVMFISGVSTTGVNAGNKRVGNKLFKTNIIVGQRVTTLKKWDCGSFRPVTKSVILSSKYLHVILSYTCIVPWNTHSNSLIYKYYYQHHFED